MCLNYQHFSYRPKKNDHTKNVEIKYDPKLLTESYSMAASVNFVFENSQQRAPWRRFCRERRKKHYPIKVARRKK